MGQSLTITPELHRLLRRDAVRALFLRPRNLLLPVLVTSLALLWLASSPAAVTGVSAATVLVVLAALMLAQRRQVTRVIDGAFPPGSVATGQVREDGLVLGGATGTSVIAYSAIRTAEVHGTVLLLRQRLGNVRLVHPALLFEEDDLAELHRRIG